LVRVKPESEIETNYKASTALVPDRFERGVRAANWQAGAVEGQDLYVQKMQMADVLARRKTGIQKVSDESWKTDTIGKGKTIIGTRMNAASGKQVAGYRPYREALVSLDLPARTADPMANLMNRGGAVVQALVNVNKAQG
jgi:hypothetical protein